MFSSHIFILSLKKLIYHTYIKVSVYQHDVFVKMHTVAGERRSILQCDSGETVAGLIKPSKLFRLVQCNDLIVTMTHNRNKEDVNLLSSLTLSVFLSLSLHHCQWRETQRETRGRNVELKTHCQVNQITPRTHQCGKYIVGRVCVCSGYIHMTYLFLLHAMLQFSKLFR